MLASLNLLKQFVDLNGINENEIADKLTFAGLEVEGISHLAEATNLVIGQILKVENHPDSDHLHVLQVDEGPKFGIHQIVCGAPNVKEGLKVIVARVGAELKAKNITIVNSTIRGVESEGMCCALNELGVDKLFLREEQINGIEELSEDAPVGEENVLEYLGLNDTVFDINVLANRSDCLSIFSLAKELGALFDREVKIPAYHHDNELKTDVKVSSNTVNCPQFSIKVVKNVVTKESPSWMKSFLMAQGIRSINNIVDIGNYIMILTGQPLHMYDLDKLDSKEFIVKDDCDIKFTALDEKEYDLEVNDILVTNNNKVACLAGVMGALYCAVDSSTKNIAIEAANFKSSAVRRTSSRIGLSSDSSSRFVKGINPLQDKFVLDLTAEYLIQYAEAKEVYQTVRYSTIDEKIPAIECSVSYINKRLGTDFDYEKITGILGKLNIQIEDLDHDNFLATPPAHRIDIKCDADLSEEVIRFAGLDSIKSSLPLMEMTLGGLTEFQSKRKMIREQLIANGLHEVLTYNLISPKEIDQYVLLNSDEPYVIKNPMTIEHSIVRKGLVSSLLNVLDYNYNHQTKDVNIFEVSDIITKNQEYNSLCVLLSGQKCLRGQLSMRPYDFYDIHGILDSIFALLGIEKSRYKEERLESSFYHPGRSTKILFGKEVVAVLGELHPTLTKDYGRVYVLEVNLTKVINLKTAKSKMELFSKYPSIKRDYAFVVSKEILAEEVIRSIKKSGKGIINAIDIFDCYEGEHIQEGFKSIALSVTYSDLNKTLTDQEINAVEQNFLDELKKAYNVELRK